MNITFHSLYINYDSTYVAVYSGRKSCENIFRNKATRAMVLEFIDNSKPTCLLLWLKFPLDLPLMSVNTYAVNTYAVNTYVSEHLCSGHLCSEHISVNTYVVNTYVSEHLCSEQHRFWQVCTYVHTCQNLCCLHLL